MVLATLKNSLSVNSGGVGGMGVGEVQYLGDTEILSDCGKYDKIIYNLVHSTCSAILLRVPVYKLAPGQLEQCKF